MRVRFTGTNHIEQANNDSGEHALCSEIGNEMFAVQLGKAIDVLRAYRSVCLFVGLVVWLVDGAAAGEHETGTWRRIQQQIDSAVDVGAHCQCRVLLTLRNVMDGSQMDNRVWSKVRHHGTHGRDICKVSLRKLTLSPLIRPESQWAVA